MPKVRVTVNLDQEVVERWQAIAKREGNSLSSVVNGWLSQIMGAAEAVASVIDEDRQATFARLRHIMGAVEAANQIYGNAAELALVTHPRSEPGGVVRARRALGVRRVRAITPPSSNTGGHSVKKRGG